MFHTTTFTIGVRTFSLFVLLLSTNWLFAADRTSPKVYTVRATSITTSSAVITWTTNEPATSQVRYGKTTNYGNLTPLDTRLLIGHSVPLSNLAANTTYNYRVLSRDAAGNLQTSSNFTFRTLAATVAPNAPSNAAAIAVSNSRIDVTWSDNSGNEAGFYVYQSTDGSSFSQVGTTGANVLSYSAQNLQSQKTYYYRVKSYNSTGSSSDSNTANATTAGTVPATPTSLTAAASSAVQIDLSWIDNSTNETGFYVYQSADGSNFSQVAILNAGAASYSSQNLQPEKTYHYRVRAYNATGTSSDSNTAMATTPGTPPSAPTNLAAAAVSASKIDLTWMDNSPNESGFYVYQSTDGTNFSQVASLNADAATYSAQNLQSKKTYYYRVRAYNTTASSSDSNTATATTPGTAPSAPTNLAAAAVSNSKIDLTWTDNSTDESGFYVYQSIDGSNFSHVATLNTNAVAYSAENLQAEMTYYYFVCAYNSVNNSLDSNIASATTNGNPSAPKAFPGAVGFGIDTPGGRGGAILKVTNLNDSGSGSLRAAVAATGPRTIIFEVSGTITLLSELRVTNPFVTIAGQTAPSPGITLKAGEFNIKTHDVIVQHIRIRLGDQLPSGTDPGGADTLSTEGPAYNVILDHVSASWGIDETGATWYDNLHDVTFSNCIISESLYNSIHPKGAHSMGLLVTPNGRNVALLGNLLAHNSDRNPLISNGSSTVVANNVFYNWIGGRATNIGNYSSAFAQKFPTEVSIIGNVYIRGYNTTSSTNAISTSTSLSEGAKIYIADNRVVGFTSVFRNVVAYNPLVSTPPVAISGFTPIPSANVESSVLANSGARPADRDEVDHRIAHEVNTRTGRLVNSQSEVGGWPTLSVNRHTINVPANANADDDGDGYTNFEEQVLFPMAAAVEGR